MILPVAALCALAPLAGGSPHRFPYAARRWATVHIAVALVAYALFVVAALQALLLTGLEKRLHRGHALRDDDGSVPLLTLERFLFRLVAAGLRAAHADAGERPPLLRAAVRQPVTFTHKNVFAVLGWLTFGSAARSAAGATAGAAGGRCTGSSAGTALLVLGYLGSKFVPRSCSAADRAAAH